MSPKQLIKKIITNACILFTVIIAIYSIIVAIIYVDDKEVLISASRTLLFFVASVLISTANAIFSLPKINTVLRFAIHYIISAFAFASCFLLPIAPIASTTFTVMALFTVVYIIGATIFAFFRARYKKKNAEISDYKSKFQKK